MTINGLADDIEKYASEQMDITVEDLAEVGNPDGQDINRGEEWSCTLRVANQGLLSVDDLWVIVTAVNGTLSRRSEGTSKASLTLGPLSIRDRSARKTDLFYFKAPDDTGPMTLFEATIGRFDVSLDPLLQDQSTESDIPLVSFSTNVVGE